MFDFIDTIKSRSFIYVYKIERVSLQMVSKYIRIFLNIRPVFYHYLLCVPKAKIFYTENYFRYGLKTVLVIS